MLSGLLLSAGCVAFDEFGYVGWSFFDKVVPSAGMIRTSMSDHPGPGPP